MTKRYSVNGYDYTLKEESDGWISIYQYQDGIGLTPVIQACDMEKAIRFCNLREPAPHFVQKLV